MMLSRIGVVLISSIPPLNCLVPALYLLLVVFIFMKPLLPASSAIRLSMYFCSKHIYQKRKKNHFVLAYWVMSTSKSVGLEVSRCCPLLVPTSQVLKRVFSKHYSMEVAHINPYATVCCSGCFIALSPGNSQILSHSRGEKSGEGLVPILHHGPEMVDLVNT